MQSMPGGVVDSVSDHSNWSVNFGNGASVGGVSAAQAIPWAWVAIGFAVWYLMRKK